MDFEINSAGSLNIIDAAQRVESDPAIVLASIDKIYSNNINEIPVRKEETRYWYDDTEFEEGIPESFSIDGCDHTPYGVSRLAADLYAQDYTARNKVDTAAFRMSCIYGPWQFDNEDQGWVAHFALSTIQDEPLTIFGDGKQVRDVLYVGDLIRVYDAFLSDPQGKSAVYNIGSVPRIRRVSSNSWSCSRRKPAHPISTLPTGARVTRECTSQTFHGLARS